ncbi:MAG TPA: SDR family oxidoreductase [Bacteroidales bacterium]|nr:SDR family oxidoreductase [Bacteroidales bacterium]HPF02389.1 SDR family oxidoreductase [Bacteroidales bacterium]HPJ58928.1 SDR family oxidoreductase [Bacteroidales bacterium]HPR12182.1 SDR family oxidoreductase [Bacteroidales bacterium]HRW84865.1 SDR family oxidoreductase [Bacteroidales bacterium]
MKKTAVITGGASGIGLAIARRFVREGIMTILVGRDVKKLKHACSVLGENSDFFQSDLSDIRSIPEMVQKIIDRYGKIDILVNNAGINLKKKILEVTDEEYQNIILTNQTSAFCITRSVAGFMQEQGAGVVLNISSMAAIYGLPYVIAYTASKSAIEGMTRAMAVELAEMGIRVNCIAPGFIRTNMSSVALEKDAERKEKVLSRTPLGRLGKPEEVANAAYFLVSDEASFITGVVLPVDGGNSVGF